MIANHSSANISARFSVISQMTQANSTQAALIKSLEAQLEAERKRAEKAEKMVRLYEAQLTHPKREAVTLSLSIGNPEDRTKADLELARRINDGWERFDSTYVANIGERTTHYITLTRVAPIAPVDPEESAVPVGAEATKPVVAATPAPESQPDTNPDALPVTRKNVTVAAILPVDQTPAPAIDDDPQPAADEAAQSAAGSEYKAVAQDAFNEALARNKMPDFTPIPSYKPKQENVTP